MKKDDEWAESDISNLPEWQGASKCYSRALDYMDRYGANHELIDALNVGDEERIKGHLLEYHTHEFLLNAGIES